MRPGAGWTLSDTWRKVVPLSASLCPPGKWGVVQGLPPPTSGRADFPKPAPRTGATVCSPGGVQFPSWDQHSLSGEEEFLSGMAVFLF